ncbi:hypothetical protein Ahu01nite_012030 [Winogradskya humida]|uniref:Squalene cyclase C-terminal domain-containing protein n=1 Tax=Winogradskya humida TaxID=113566 RepID=A0ABQ3ZHP1_9ACTN|nr:hypothetical protein Ahu01nite_012030 [Actinoplanes humidus]
MPQQSGTALDAAIARGHAWLWSSYIPEPRGGAGAGWPQFPGTTELTVWGGTVDGIRAQYLEHTGRPLNDRLRDALIWVRTQQVESGGFDSCEVEYPSAEATAWALVAFGELGLDGSDPTVKGALTYLLDCVAPGGGVMTTPADIQDQRTMPTALALWAFAKYRESLRRRGEEGVIEKIVEHLKLAQDPDSRAWGVSHGAVPNVATTAQVVFALCEAGVSPREDVVRGATAFIISRQSDNGSWPNSYDEWFTVGSPRRPQRCLNYSAWRALLALMHSAGHDPAARRACRQAVRHLVDMQSADGAWRFEDYESNRHVWLTAQIVVALHSWRRTWAQHDSRSPGRQLSETLAHGFTLFRRNAVVIVLGILVARELLPVTLRFVVRAGRVLGIDRASMSNNLLSTAVWALLAALVAAAITRFHHRR